MFEEKCVKLFFFLLDYTENDLQGSEDRTTTFHFHTRDPNVIHGGTGVAASVVLISDDYRTGERWLFLLQISITITSHLTHLHPRGPPGGPNRHLDLPTAKFTSTSTQRKKPIKLEQGKCFFFRWAASEKEHDQWSAAGSNGESQKPKMGWTLHKKPYPNHTHSWVWCGFLLLLPGYAFVALIWSQPEPLPRTHYAGVPLPLSSLKCHCLLWGAFPGRLSTVPRHSIFFTALIAIWNNFIID